MKPLVRKHMCTFRLVQAERQINPRPEKAEHERRIHPVTFKHILRARHADRAAHTAVEPHKGNRSVNDQSQQPQNPDRCADEL